MRIGVLDTKRSCRTRSSGRACASGIEADSNRWLTDPLRGCLPARCALSLLLRAAQRTIRCARLLGDLDRYMRCFPTRRR